MKANKVHTIYFSPAHSTRTVVKAVAEGIGVEVINHDITQGIKKLIEFAENDVAVIGVPVYSGRVPVLAAKYLSEIYGSGVPAILVCVYGNRDYEDALLELEYITEDNGFIAVGAGAFIARHSIFPKVAEGRPNSNDLEQAKLFGKRCFEKYNKSDVVHLHLKGNIPYRMIKSVPLLPKRKHGCDNCGVCVELCPTGAIDKNNPKRIDKTKCIACARCIEVCPKRVRYFGGLLYTLVSWKFAKDNAQPKEVELFLP